MIILFYFLKYNLIFGTIIRLKCLYSLYNIHSTHYAEYVFRILKTWMKNVLPIKNTYQIIWTSEQILIFIRVPQMGFGLFPENNTAVIQMLLLGVQIDHKESVKKNIPISNVGGWCDAMPATRRIFDISKYFGHINSYK